MQYSLVNNETVEAFPNGKGFCPKCHAPTISKCGPRNIHHWAHNNIRDCDPWWENETEWHRKWKNLFPKEYREVTHSDENGEIHRADIKTQTNIIIEIQHSAITDAERVSREIFYKNIVWIIDGSSFKKNFDMYHMLPDPKSEMASDLVWAKAQRNMLGANKGMFYRLSEARINYPDIKKYEACFGLIHQISEIQNEIEENYNGYHQYGWIRPRSTWLDATCPVYIDFNDEYLYELKTYDESNLRCVKLISKKKFIHDVVTETDVHQIGTRYYKIN